MGRSRRGDRDGEIETGRSRRGDRDGEIETGRSGWGDRDGEIRRNPSRRRPGSPRSRDGAAPRVSRRLADPSRPPLAPTPPNPRNSGTAWPPTRRGGPGSWGVEAAGAGPGCGAGGSWLTAERLKSRDFSAAWIRGSSAGLPADGAACIRPRHEAAVGGSRRRTPTGRARPKGREAEEGKRSAAAGGRDAGPGNRRNRPHRSEAITLPLARSVSFWSKKSAGSIAWYARHGACWKPRVPISHAGPRCRTGDGSAGSEPSGRGRGASSFVVGTPARAFRARPPGHGLRRETGAPHQGAGPVGRCRVGRPSRPFSRRASAARRPGQPVLRPAAPV